MFYIILIILIRVTRVNVQQDSNPLLEFIADQIANGVEINADTAPHPVDNYAAKCYYSLYGLWQCAKWPCSFSKNNSDQLSVERGHVSNAQNFHDHVSNSNQTFFVAGTRNQSFPNQNKVFDSLLGQDSSGFSDPYSNPVVAQDMRVVGRLWSLFWGHPLMGKVQHPRPRPRAQA